MFTVIVFINAFIKLFGQNLITQCIFSSLHVDRLLTVIFLHVCWHECSQKTMLFPQDTFYLHRVQLVHVAMHRQTSPIFSLTSAQGLLREILVI